MCTVAIARPAVGHRTKRGHDRFRRGWHPKPALPVPLDPQSPVVQTLRPGAENLAAQRVHALPNTKLRFLERRRAGRGSKRLTTDRDQLRQRLQNPSRQAGKIDGRAGCRLRNCHGAAPVVAVFAETTSYPPSAGGAAPPPALQPSGRDKIPTPKPRLSPISPKGHRKRTQNLNKSTGYHRHTGLAPVERLFRWSEVPVPYGQQGAHGTIVASVAAGTNLGVAPGAAIIPIAINLSDDQIDNALADTALRFAITLLPRSDRLQLDDLLADSYRDDYEKFDIINRSYGIDLFDPDVISANIASELDWYRRYLPKTLDATLQIGTPESQKTILVYAAGNANQPYSGIGADLPYYLSELRGHSLSVVATDPQTGTIASYSNRCGSLPPDWNTVRHGRHYCLAAPGTVRGLVPDANTRGYGNARGGLQGTSFAAPVVSGALALLKEHFRGTRGNTEIVKRMIDTADRSGRYADLETYGAGHLDIASALSPVGALNAGQSAQALAQTALRTPAAFGALTQRTAALELAAFDAQNFPFWIPLPDLISTPSGGRSPIPEISDTHTHTRDAPAPGLDVLGLHWAPFEDAGGLPFLDDRQWAMGFGQTSASLARLPRNGEWGYGLSLDNSGYLDSETSGAFGSDLQSGTIWTSRVFKRELGEGWMLNAEGTLALSMPQYQNKAIFQASSSVMSAMSLRAGTQDTGISLEQPLRAETGTGTFRIENGRIENGRRLYDKYHIPLPPDARELRLALRHEEHAPGGKVAFEVGHSVNAGHVPGETETRIGFAYRAAW